MALCLLKGGCLINEYVVVADDGDFINCIFIARTRARAIERAMEYLNEMYSQRIPTECYLGCLEKTTNDQAEMIHVYRKNGSVLDTVFILEYKGGRG